MKSLQISSRGANVIASPLRKFLPYMYEAEKKGIKVYKMSAGDPDLEVPEEFFAEIKRYGSKNLPYAPSPGIVEHVDAWITYYKQFGVTIEPKNIIPTVGCAEAILLALMAVADIGDEILVFEPLYVSYKSFAVMIGIKLVPITLKAESGFAMPADSEIESKITDKTKAIVVINPDNPTGKLWSEEELARILGIAKRNNIFVIADETYREIRFDGRTSCMLAMEGAKETVVLVDSVSKRYSMPGARVGCLVSYNLDIMGAVLKFAQARLSVGTLEQYGLIPLMSDSKKYTDPVVAEYKKRCEVVYQGLSTMAGVVVTRPMGAFYIYAALPVDSAENFVKYMISEFSDNGETVMISPMPDFYITEGLGVNEIRIAYVLHEDKLARSMEILRKGLEAYPGRIS
ncbi:MAG: pyridoxal phosphate-dependent aminotransferase [Candidatus Pacebacteria bacterium]|nr:pyridoxal phosphate-dependent aminotransferase [Candidatus Paceibacterota bacterium]